MWTFFSVLAVVVGVLALARIGARASLDYIREARAELRQGLTEAAEDQIDRLRQMHLEQAQETEGAISEIESKVAALQSAQALRRR